MTLWGALRRISQQRINRPLRYLRATVDIYFYSIKRKLPVKDRLGRVIDKVGKYERLAQPVCTRRQ